ncbi:MAG: hypothetical protein K2M02_05150 [Duncaniella sp.]|nr:hypothetical protein [Duncaniella sp.]
MRFNYILLLLSCAAMLFSCSSREKKAVYDSDEAYRLGQTQAERIINCADEETLQDSLLEIRSRIYHIGVNVGVEQAGEFERGFVDYIKQNNDSLAREIF